MTRTEMYYAVSDKHEKYRLKFSRFSISYVKAKQYLKPNNVKDNRWTATDFVHSNREVVTKPCMQTTRLRREVLSIMPEIPEISVVTQMERSVLVYSDRNIRYHVWRWSTLARPTEVCRSILANSFIALLLFTHLGNSEKEYWKMIKLIPLGWPGFDRKMSSIFFGYSTLVSDRSVWNNEKHPRLTFKSKLVTG